MLSLEQVRRAPKVVLHDHLDGGLRPATLVDLADAGGYDGLPATDPDELAHLIRSAAAGGGLEGYLATFAHTTGVMQTAEAIERVAYECAEDHHRDGVVAGEVRMAPELCTREGLSPDDVVEAIVAGFARARGDYGVDLTLLVCGLRDLGEVAAAAEVALRWRDRGVAGFDIAGPEAGFPPSQHAEVFTRLRRENLPFTIHAGEAAGLESISGALHDCGALRLGHGMRIIDDVDGVSLGRLAGWVRDRQVPLELCPTSNVHTAAAPSIAEHPVGALHTLGFRVTVNPDNRLMSGVTVSSEVHAVAEAFDLDLADVEALQVAAAESLFAPLPQRRRLVSDVLRPGFARLADAGQR